MKVKDERIKIVNEVLSGIKIIKLYGWEKAFIKKITKERDKEVYFNKNIKLLELASSFLISISSNLVLIITISAYLFLDYRTDFTNEQAFVSLALLNLIKNQICDLPILFNYFSMCKVSLHRLVSFLAEEELENYINRSFDKKMALTIKNARFLWDGKDNPDSKLKKSSKKKSSRKNLDKSDNKSDDESDYKSGDKLNGKLNQVKKPFELKDIELEVPKGSFLAIIGSVGSGKLNY